MFRGTSLRMLCWCENVVALSVKFSSSYNPACTCAVVIETAPSQKAGHKRQITQVSGCPLES
ncbi:hypothetical protein IscW_ISCW007486 [Ixodes scapularis]|uniref:Secreted protein n=1 Tax=Ixodes scapularis TaxID=6945 RepID=B7PSE7_IXOSC|nr:hypothetical protein IscW_ISCW007486 [Ixodes scapularis]|eukprot:XP_002402329.1 hypothetical protein IscW_ISCW007486 [Ixodes scapularis]